MGERRPYQGDDLASVALSEQEANMADVKISTQITEDGEPLISLNGTLSNKAQYEKMLDAIYALAGVFWPDEGEDEAAEDAPAQPVAEAAPVAGDRHVYDKPRLKEQPEVKNGIKISTRAEGLAAAARAMGKL